MQADLDAIRVRFDKHWMPEPNSGCYLWLGLLNVNGYGMFSRDGRKVLAHRQSWSLSNGAIPKGLFVCHHCDNRICVNVGHLFLGTHQDNMDDMARKGRKARNGNGRGSENTQAILTESDVLAILADKRSYSALAEAYGVSPSTIGMIRTKRIWRHLHG